MGLGYGSLGCQDCASRANGASGGLSFGGTVTDRFLIGLGTTGWTKSDVSITPFWDGFAMANSNIDANVGQLGIGVTFH